MESNENLLGIIRSLNERKKEIILITIIVAISSVIISFLIPEYYKAETIFYPASPDLAKPSPLGNTERDRQYYGNGNDLDRLLSIAASSEVIREIDDKFNLNDHYGINDTTQLGKFKVKTRLESNYEVLRTKFDAIKLSIEDKDPRLAFEMTNFARETINAKAQQLIKKSQKSLIKTLKNTINKQESLVIKLIKSIDSLRYAHNIYDTEKQGTLISDRMTKLETSLSSIRARKEAFKSVNRDSVLRLSIQEKGIIAQYEVLNDKSSKYYAGVSKLTLFQDELDDSSIQLSVDKERLKLLTSAFSNDFDALHIVEPAVIPIKKSRPRRSLIVLSTTFLAFAFSCIGAVIFSFYKKVNWSKLLKNDSSK